MANKLRVVNSFSNALFNRREISLVVEHNKESTPTKDYVRKELSTNFSVPENQIYVFGMKTKFGSHTTDVQAHLYSNFDEKNCAAACPETNNWRGKTEGRTKNAKGC